MKPEPSIYIGTAGWNYRDWYGIVYPENPGKSFKELDYLASFLDTAEVNSTFYRPAPPYMSSAWIKKVSHNPRFLFTAKLWQRFTHQREPYGQEDLDQVYRGMDPLMDAGKLGALLAQFPWSFKNDASGTKWLDSIIDSFLRYPLVMEFRHASWDKEEVRRYLDSRGVGLASIDQPVIGKSVSFKPVCTGGTGYVRMHGRNYKAWFPPKTGKDAGPDRGEKTGAAGQTSGRSPDRSSGHAASGRTSPAARYDYLYSEKEIHEIAETVKQVSEKAPKTFVIQNNHPFGQAVANAIQLKAELEGADIRMPATLLGRFPFLSRVAVPVSYGESRQATAAFFASSDKKNQTRKESIEKPNNDPPS